MMNPRELGTMKTISIKHFKFFAKQERLETLNRVAVLHNIWDTKLLTGATGCTREQALEFMMLLFHLGVAVPTLAVYHICDYDAIVAFRSFGEGFPKLPWVCPECEEYVTDEDELTYDFRFSLMTQVEFTS